MKIEELPPGFVELNRKELGFPVPPTEVIPAGKKTMKDKRAERLFQAQVEGWLRLRGYWPRFPHHMQIKPQGVDLPIRGWQIHLHEAERNPILLDVLLLGSDGRFLEFELKVAGGDLTPEQNYLVTFQGRKVCWNFEQVKDLVERWEAGNLAKAMLDLADELERPAGAGVGTADVHYHQAAAMVRRGIMEWLARKL